MFTNIDLHQAFSVPSVFDKLLQQYWFTTGIYQFRASIFRLDTIYWNIASTIVHFISLQKYWNNFYVLPHIYIKFPTFASQNPRIRILHGQLTPINNLYHWFRSALSVVNHDTLDVDRSKLRTNSRRWMNYVAWCISP